MINRYVKTLILVSLILGSLFIYVDSNAQITQQLTEGEDSAFNDLSAGKYIPYDDARLLRMRNLDSSKLLKLDIQIVSDASGKVFYHQIPDKVISMNNEQMTFLINQRNSAIRRKEALPNGNDIADKFETECSIVLNEKEFYSGKCAVAEDSSNSFPMVGIYPSVKNFPYFLIWRHMPTHEKSGRSADMLYWNGKNAISNKAGIFITEIAGQMSSMTSDASVCWSGGKNNICYKNKLR